MQCLILKCQPQRIWCCLCLWRCFFFFLSFHFIVFLLFLFVLGAGSSSVVRSSPVMAQKLNSFATMTQSTPENHKLLAVICSGFLFFSFLFFVNRSSFINPSHLSSHFSFSGTESLIESGLLTYFNKITGPIFSKTTLELHGATYSGKAVEIAHVPKGYYCL